MGFLGSDQPSATIANGLMIQTSTNVLPVPVGWGRFPVAPNLFWAGDFNYTDNSGGKGFGGKGGQSYYSASLMFGLCEGFANDLYFVYEGISYTNGPDWLSSVSAAFFPGSYPDQDVWDFLTADHPDQALNYPGTCWVGAANLNLGGSPVPPNFTFVVDGPLWGSATWTALANYGADIALIIQDFLTNQQYGVSNFPAGSLNLNQLLSSGSSGSTGDAAFQTYCRSIDVTFAPVLQSVEKASSILDRWTQLTNTALCFYDGALQFIPRGDTETNQHGAHFVPNLTPVYALTIDDFVNDDKDCGIQISRVAPEDVYNVVRVECYNSYNYFAPLPIEWRDETAIATDGMLRIMPTITGHEIVDPYFVAPQVASLIGQRQQNIRLTYTFKLSWELGTILTPMDIVTLTDIDMGLDAVPVRIQSLEEDDKGIITVTAENFPVGVADTPLYPVEQPPPSPVNLSAPAGAVNASPMITEPSPSTTGGVAQIWVGASGGSGGEVSPVWGGAVVWASTDGTTYQQIGKISGPAVQGTLTAPLNSFTGTNPDNTDTLSVNVNMSGGTLTSYPATAARTGASLCFVDGELLSYETATLTSISFPVSEAQTVPAAPGPYTIDVTYVSDWVSDLGVTYANGTPLTLVMGAPATGQYAVDSGTYTFAAGDAGAGVIISYVRSGSGYDLTGLYRGLSGTQPNAHPTGSQFTLINGNTSIMRMNLPASYIGVPLYLKLQSFNTWGGGLQDLADCAVYTYTPTGNGYAPTLEPLLNPDGADMTDNSGNPVSVNVGS